MADLRRNPEGLGPIFPISASLVARRHPVSVAPRSLNSEKLAPSAGHAKVNNRLLGENMAEFTLRIDGMHCGSCVRRVSQALASTGG